MAVELLFYVPLFLNIFRKNGIHSSIFHISDKKRKNIYVYIPLLVTIYALFCLFKKDKKKFIQHVFIGAFITTLLFLSGTNPRILFKVNLKPASNPIKSFVNTRSDKL